MEVPLYSQWDFKLISKKDKNTIAPQNYKKLIKIIKTILKMPQSFLCSK